jgi:AcrR family transcriptional regulator
MSKIVKKPEDRHNEFLGVAQTLFVEKGYESTSVDDIVQRMGVAKGLFYYYFDSKEELLAIMAERLIDEIRSSIAAGMEKEGLTAVQRFRELFTLSPDITDRTRLMATYFHTESFRGQHHAMEERSMAFLLPVIERLVKQGIDEGVFHTDYPKETAIALMASWSKIKHTTPSSSSPDELMHKAKALQYLAERLLGAKPGTFEFFLEMLPPKGCVGK